MSGMDEKTILIVDDAAENIAILAELLGTYNLKVATNGEKALKILNTSQNIDLVLLDILMPLMNGFEVAETMKANPKLEQTPIIFITGQSDVHSFVKGFDLGAEEYITKPFDRETVLRIVEQTLLRKGKDEK
jgi:CheY-like chemotaxis protein